MKSTDRPGPFLAVDIGNTRVAFGLYEEEESPPRLAWHLATDRRRTADEYGALCRAVLQKAGRHPVRLRGAATVSVVPSAEPAVEAMLPSWFGVEAVPLRWDSQGVLQVRYQPPGDAGADRIVNAAYAFARFGGPVLVIDAGTAVTFDLASREGEFLGGAIFPGPALLAEALSRGTARLPEIAGKHRPDPVGDSTRGSIQAGLHFGLKGAVRELLAAYRERFGPELRTVLTGGARGALEAAAGPFDAVEPSFTLDAVRYLGEKVHHGNRTR